MAWYRCGGGGIPSSLKGDMNDVFNKKFGTVLQDYPPEDWPGTVNLMGPLPERTVSGAVVTFPDGADAVKLKSCAVTIAPNLDGVSSVDVISAGKNLVDISGTDPDNGYTDDRWLSSINTYNNNNDWHITEYLPILPNTDYTLSGIAYGNAPSVCFYDENKDFISGISYANRSSFTFTSPPTTKYVRFSIRYDFTEFMMEYGTTATAYEPYITPTTHTATLGRTIHGGEVDVVNGTGTDENGNDFTFTPVPILSRLGDNTMWSDEGDLSVTYRRDIDLALAQ